MNEQIPPPPCNVNKREFWVDVSKTILIFVMVVGHCNPYLWVRTLIYGCHMPAFLLYRVIFTNLMIGRRLQNHFLYQ